MGGFPSYKEREHEEFVQDLLALGEWVEEGLARFIGRHMDNHTCAEMRGIVDIANRSSQEKYRCPCHFSIHGVGKQQAPSTWKEAFDPTETQKLSRWLEGAQSNRPTEDVQVSLALCPGHKRMMDREGDAG